LQRIFRLVARSNRTCMVLLAAAWQSIGKWGQLITWKSLVWCYWQLLSSQLASGAINYLAIAQNSCFAVTRLRQCDSAATQLCSNATLEFCFAVTQLYGNAASDFLLCGNATATLCGNATSDFCFAATRLYDNSLRLLLCGNVISVSNEYCPADRGDETLFTAKIQAQNYGLEALTLLA